MGKRSLIHVNSKPICLLQTDSSTYYMHWNTFTIFEVKWNEVAQLCPTLCDPIDCIRLLHPWDFPGKSAGVDCHFLLQGIFPTQESNPGLPHCRQMLYRLSHQGSPHNFYVYVNKWTRYCPKEKRQEKVESGNVRERNITEGEKQLIRDKRILLDLATGNNWKSEDLIKVDKNVERWTTIDDNAFTLADEAAKMAGDQNRRPLYTKQGHFLLEFWA